MAVVLVLGFSNIFADALSMGVGEYLSSKVRPVVNFRRGQEHVFFADHASAREFCFSS